MVTAKMIRYNISESFNLVRWCLTIIAFAFACVVSVAKYIQISDMTAITFSSLEITYLILNDTVSLIYIYLPLYLFLICGIMFDDNFGSLESLSAKVEENGLLGNGSLYCFIPFYFL